MFSVTSIFHASSQAFRLLSMASLQHVSITQFHADSTVISTPRLMEIGAGQIGGC